MNWIFRTLTLLWSLTLTRGDDTVTCLVSQVCLLPCQSNYLDVIHWQKMNGQNPKTVHSFYNGINQLGHQDAAYKGRTSLPDQLPKGNISLILSGVSTEDRGRYKCYTANAVSNKEAFVNVKVKAPVKSVDITMTDDGITCKTSDVYPEPKITWTVDVPPKTVDVPSSEPQVKSGFFSLASTVPSEQVQDNLTYTCSISFEDGTQTYTASMVHKKAEIDSGQNITVQCPKSLGDTGSFTLTLTFEGSSPVLSYNSQTSQSAFPKQWNGIEVKLTHEENIELHKLDSEKYAGTYTCERTTTESRQIMQTSVQIKSASTNGIVIGVIVFVIAVVAVALLILLILKRRKKSQNKEEDKQPEERIIFNTVNNGQTGN